MVYQQFVNYPSLTVYENIASPLRVAGVGQGGDRRARQEAARFLRLESPAAAHARPAVRRPAAAHRHRARARQARRPRPARRAARQSRLQAARGIARGTAAHFRPHRRDPGLRDDRAGRGAAARRLDRHACAKAASPNSGRRRQSIAIPPTSTRRACFPIRRSTNLPCAKRAARSTTCERPGARPASARFRGRPTAPIGSAFAPTRRRSARPRPASLSFPGKVAVTEISGSESFVHVDVGLGVWVGLSRAFTIGRRAPTVDGQHRSRRALRLRRRRRVGGACRRETRLKGPRHELASRSTASRIATAASRAPKPIIS